MVGRTGAFLDLIHATVPALGREFEPAISFSHELAPAPDRLLVLPVPDVGWCDLGNPARVLASLRRTVRQPTWLAAAEVASIA